VRREGRFKFIREDIVIHRIYLFNSAAYISIILFIQTPHQHYIYYSDVFWRYKIVIQYNRNPQPHIVLMLKYCVISINFEHMHKALGANAQNQALLVLERSRSHFHILTCF
jgi:hypothetical protein